MAYSEAQAARVRKLLRAEEAVEKEMFGGLAFLLRGNLAVGVLGEDLIVRCGPAQADALLREPGARRFDMTGRPMKGWLLVGPAGTKGEAALKAWVARSVAYAGSLPAKAAKGRKA